MSIFHAHPELLIAEALSLSVARRYMNMWPTGEVAAYRDTVFAALEKLPSATRSRNKYRVYVPFALDQTERQIRDAMKAAGYTIRNYATGDAIEDKTGRVMTMGKVLSTRMKRDDLATLYSRDQMRRDYGNQPSNTLLVFSYHPYDIAGMSTGRSWTSCMTIATEKSEGGSNSQYVSFDIAKGTFVCYLIQSDDRNIQRPMARMLIKPFINTDNPSLILYLPEEKAYAPSNVVGGPPTMVSTVIDIMRDAQAPFYDQYEGTFTLTTGLYCDATSSVFDLSSPSLRWLEKPFDMPTTRQEALDRAELLARLGVIPADGYEVAPDLSVIMGKSNLPSGNLSLNGQLSPYIRWAAIPMSIGSDLNSVRIKHTNITSLVGSPRRVGNLDLFNNQRLVSLDGSPDVCESKMSVTYSPQLKTLRGGPTSAGSVILANLGITSLEGMPTTRSLEVTTCPLRSLTGISDHCRHVKLQQVPLTSLQGSPRTVEIFKVHSSKLTTLQGGPSEVETLFHCGESPLVSYKGAPRITRGTTRSGSFVHVVTPATKSFDGLPSGPNVVVRLWFRRITNLSWEFSELARHRKGEQVDYINEWPLSLLATLPSDITLDALELAHVVDESLVKQLFPFIWAVRTITEMDMYF